MRTAVILGATLVFGIVLGLSANPGPSTRFLFEGGRLIAGDRRVPTENAAFLVEGTRFTRVGAKGEFRCQPAERASTSAERRSYPH